jgi:hypothetical protein
VRLLVTTVVMMCLTVPAVATVLFLRLFMPLRDTRMGNDRDLRDDNHSSASAIYDAYIDPCAAEQPSAALDAADRGLQTLRERG